MKHYLNVFVFLTSCLLLFTFPSIAQSVNADAFEKGIEAGNVQVFDVRTADEYNSGHIAGTLQADYTDKKQFEERVKYLDKQKPVYIYCLSGGRSSSAAKWMRENGFREVVELEGGVRAWKGSGKSLEGAVEEKQLAVSEFRQSVEKGLLLVDVGATWCPPCRAMEPVLQQFLQQHKQVQLVKVDGGRDQEVMKAIGAKGLPTFIFYKDGKEQWRKQGIVELTELEALLK